MQSIDKLREYAKTCVFLPPQETVTVCEIADEIEAEIERDYMRLPVGADGVPIRVGDVLEWTGIDGAKERFTVYGYTAEYSTWTDDVPPLMTTNENATEFYCHQCRHYHAPTVEDVLNDYRAYCELLLREFERGDWTVDEYPKELEKANGEYAEKLREVLRDE